MNDEEKNIANGIKRFLNNNQHEIRELFTVEVSSELTLSFIGIDKLIEAFRKIAQEHATSDQEAMHVYLDRMGKIVNFNDKWNGKSVEEFSPSQFLAAAMDMLSEAIPGSVFMARPRPGENGLSLDFGLGPDYDELTDPTVGKDKKELN